MPPGHECSGLLVNATLTWQQRGLLHVHGMQDLDAELKRMCEQAIADVARSVADAASGVLARVRRY